MKKTSLSLAMASLLGATGAQAAFFDANSTYTVTVTSASCFAFGDCTTLVNNVPGGSFTLATDATGAAFSTGSYTMGAYTGTPGGLFSTGGPVAGSGSVSDAGQLDLDFTGRTGSATLFPYLGTPAWNIDNGVAGGTGAYEGFTTGADSNVSPTDGSVSLTLTGSNLSLVNGSPSGIGTWTGQLVSIGNVGAAWGPFAGTPYSEVYTISVSGHVPDVSQIPVPAAVWLFGSGLAGLVGVARRRKRA